MSGGPATARTTTSPSGSTTLIAAAPNSRNSTVASAIRLQGLVDVADGAEFAHHVEQPLQP